MQINKHTHTLIWMTHTHHFACSYRSFCSVHNCQYRYLHTQPILINKKSSGSDQTGCSFYGFQLFSIVSRCFAFCSCATDSFFFFGHFEASSGELTEFFFPPIVQSDDLRGGSSVAMVMTKLTVAWKRQSLRRKGSWLLLYSIKIYRYEFTKSALSGLILDLLLIIMTSMRTVYMSLILSIAASWIVWLMLY